MDLDRLWQMLQSLADRVPAEWHLASAWPLAALLAVSVLIGLYGERIIRLVVLVVFVLSGAAFGQQAAVLLGVSPVAMMVLCGSLGGVYTIVFYRASLALALAVVVGAVCAAGYIGASLSRDELVGALSVAAAEVSAGMPVPEQVASPDWPTLAQQLAAMGQRVAGLVQAVWDKPGGLKEMLVVVLAGAGAGLFAGLLLGRLAAIVLTSVLGAAGVLIAAANLLVGYVPQSQVWLSDYRQAVLVAGVVLALLFAARQYGRRRAAVAAASGGELAADPNKS